jgi:2-dehydropantoate 2-reductase
LSTLWVDHVDLTFQRLAAVRVAVIGAGAIGAVVASASAEAGHDVVVCVRTPFKSLEIIREDVALVVRAQIATVAPGPYADVVFVAVKAIDVASTAPHLAVLCGPETLTVAILNGLDQAERVAPHVPAHAGPVAPAIAYIASELISPGRVKHISGHLLVVPEIYAEVVGAALGAAMNVRAANDMVTASWEKLLGNLVANPITALTLRHMDVMRSPGIPELGRNILVEACAVGRAEGAKLQDNQVDLVLERLGKFGPETGNSMLYDRLAGRPTEHQFLTGEVVRRATEHGIAVPVNEALLALLEAQQPGAD